ncbi:MAG: carbohydrate ABC transporter permease [Erysipelotrichaceae bacterium]|jgi:multiple sugar transport system permease protein|nr:carbohydrate ABC transporter permease [Erysipelotrichaceae bacterium]
MMQKIFSFLQGKKRNWLIPLILGSISLILSLIMMGVLKINQGDFFNHLLSAFIFANFFTNIFVAINYLGIILLALIVILAIHGRKGHLDIYILAAFQTWLAILTLAASKSSANYAFYQTCAVIQAALLAIIYFIALFSVFSKYQSHATIVGRFLKRIFGVLSLRNKTDGLLTYSDYKKWYFKLIYGILFIILVGVLIFALLPILWLIASAFKSTQELQSEFSFFPKDFDITKVGAVFMEVQFYKYMLNSLVVSFMAIIFSVLFNGLLAYAISIIKPKFHRIAFGAIMISYMIPAILGIVPLFGEINAVKEFISKIFGNSRLFLEYGYLNYFFLALAFGANAFYFIMFKNFFDSIPKSLIEAARVDGASNLQIFFRVVLPISMPIVGIVAIFTLTASWADFLLPELLLTDSNFHTLMVSIFNYKNNMGTLNGSEDKLLMYLVLSMIPQVILFVVFQKQIMNSNVSSGIKE